MAKAKKFRKTAEAEGDDYGPFAPAEDSEASLAEFTVGNNRSRIRGLWDSGVTPQDHGSRARNLRKLLRQEARRKKLNRETASRVTRSRRQTSAGIVPIN